uniref:Uncharacterized protein n=1 Tax=Anser brachyrhynchus TaxID=132585 RepID=A0A8B9CNM6_9AVES
MAQSLAFTCFWRAVLPVLRNWGLIRGRSASSTRGKTSKTNRLEPAKATKPILAVLKLKLKKKKKKKKKKRKE